MTVAFISFWALISSMVAVTGCFGLARKIAPSGGLSQALAALGVMVACAVFLSLRTWFYWAWAPWVVWILLVYGAFNLLSLMRVWLAARDRSQLGRGQNLVHNWHLGVVAVFVIGEWYWAALPLYRYDQWNYHLVVAKWVHELGILKGPVTVDHVFFTGGYEYLGLLARVLFADDAFQQGFQNAFSSIFLGAISFQVMVSQRRFHGRESLLIGMAFMLAVYYGSGDHEGLSSAKPDFILMLASLLGFIILTDRKIFDEIGPLSFGWVMGACLALKISWLHFLISFLPIAAIVLFQSSGTVAIVRFVAGFAIGSLCALPMLIKNFQFFGNPLHPAQSPVWKSFIWNGDLAYYWQVILQKPLTAISFVENFVQILIGVPGRLLGPILIGLSAFTIHWLQRRRQGMGANGDTLANDYRIWPAWAVFLLYVMTWGFFYGAQIGHRFVMGIPALGFWGIYLYLPRLRLSPVWTASVLLTPFLAFGQFEVTLYKIGLAWGRTRSEYHSLFAGSPSSMNQVLDIVRRHREGFFGAAVHYNEAVLMSDHVSNFYGSSVFYDLTSPVTAILMKRDGVDPDTGCLNRWMSERSIRYIWMKDQSRLNLWPKAVQNVLGRLEEIPAPVGRLWFVRDYGQITCQ